MIFLLFAFVTEISTIVLLVILVIYKYFISRNYWEKQNVLCHNPSLYQNIIQYKKPMHVSEMELYEKYGRVYGRFDGNTAVLTVAEPDLLREVLETSFPDFYNRRFIQFGDPVMDNILSSLNDDAWKRVRGVLTPNFTTAKLKQMLYKINDCADRTVDRLRETMVKHEAADLERLFGAYIMDIIACCAFGTEIDSLESPDNPFVKHAKMFFTVGYSWKGLLAQYFPFVMKLFRISIFNRTASIFFRDFTLKVIEERKNVQEPSVDFVQFLLESVRDSDNPTEDLEKYIKKDELISQCVMFFMAGYDTTTTLLQYTMYSLALHPDIQDKLYTEIQDAIGDHDDITYEDLNAVEYLDNIVYEVLRLSGTCVRMERLVKNDHVLQNDIRLKRGQLISLPFYCIHHDPEWYPEPYRFNPERFTKEAKSQRSKYVYLPFGIGRRSCIGNRFALMEAKLCIIKILKIFKISLSPKMKVPLSFNEKQGTLIPERVLVNVEAR